MPKLARFTWEAPIRRQAAPIDPYDFPDGTYGHTPDLHTINTPSARVAHRKTAVSMTRHRHGGFRGDDPEAFAAFKDYFGDGATQDEFEEAYQGVWNNEEDFAQNLADDLDSVPGNQSWPCMYIDWSRAADDLFSGDYWSSRVTGSPSIYVFRVI